MSLYPEINFGEEHVPQQGNIIYIFLCIEQIENISVYKQSICYKIDSENQVFSQITTI